MRKADSQMGVDALLHNLVVVACAHWRRKCDVGNLPLLRNVLRNGSGTKE